MQSEIGKGSTFRILFPVCTGPVEHAASPVAASSLPGGDERILFVDDESLMAELGERRLTRFGYKVTPCTDSLAALDLFKANPDAFDLVVTDQTMPKLTGLHLTEEIRRVRPDIPVVLCSGFSDAINEAALNKAGIGRFLLKPVPPETMAGAVRAALDENKRKED